jgi:aldehyde dehydrogenase (NAD+)
MDRSFLKELGIEDSNPGGFAGEWVGSGAALDICSPIDGEKIASVTQVTEAEYDSIVDKADAAYREWRKVPAPVRGEIIRQYGNVLREHKAALGRLVTLEMGKIAAEGEGEVQEMIDICDFAVGLSRQLYGKTMASERPDHRMYDQWHPLGVVGIISAFNFPVAVWCWNSSLATVCGNTTVWKPSEHTPLTAIACIKLAQKVCADNDVDPAVFSLAVGEGASIGQRLIEDTRIPLVSATGSTRMGRHVGQVVAKRFGKSILELGGNNALIVTPSADLGMALRATLFGSVGTAGQRCTTTRRILIHRSVKDEFVSRLTKAYEGVKIGNPLADDTLMGPLFNDAAVENMMASIEKLKAEGGKVLYGGEKLDGPEYPGGRYVTPCIGEAENSYEVVQTETFAPILYIIPYGDASKSPAEAVAELPEVIEMHNDVPQGLSSAIFTMNMQEAELFLSARGSDCGIANVNIGTSGAEIGGAFGGEKETGGGRESGSDAWQGYMRRQTNTVNWSSELPLAQGIQFGD